MTDNTPWIFGNLVFSRAVLDDVDAHALAEYPKESCGFLVGPASDAPRVDGNVRAVNMADKLHKLDPERYPRTAETYFEFNALAYQRAEEQGNKTGRPIKVIYHSHCDCGAYFSETDRSAAAPEGALAYPVAWLVTSVLQGKIADRKLFIFKDNAWHEAPFSIEEPSS